ncbi:MAG: spore coat U domain-containing protein [Alcanivorax sp.]|nr:spore coat U domain-containing protein [Alcanivorax sp.]
MTGKTTLRLGLLALLLCVAPQTWSAVNCSITNSPVLTFGNVDPFTQTIQDATVQLSWECNRGWFDSTANTMCIYASPGNGPIAPRQLTNPAGGPSLNFNLFRDPARSVILGQPGEAVSTGLAVNVSLPLLQFSANGTVTLYGRLLTPLPANARAGQHVNMLVNSRVAVRTGGTGQSCDNVIPPVSSTYTLQTQVNIQDQCRVETTDMDFGTQGLLLNAVDSTSAVRVRCSNQTAFTVQLNDGLHASGGNRRMRSANNHHLVYELFRDAARSQRWGSAAGQRVTGTGIGPGNIIELPVYGRVPAAPSAPPGSYSDTITVMVEF